MSHEFSEQITRRPDGTIRFVSNEGFYRHTYEFANEADFHAYSTRGKDTWITRWHERTDGAPLGGARPETMGAALRRAGRVVLTVANGENERLSPRGAA